MSAIPAADTVVSAIRVGTELDEITRATAWFGEVAEAEDWPQKVRFGLELSLEEALTNVISYGFVGVAYAPHIEIQCLALPHGRYGVRIIDNGTPFDPTAVPEPEASASLEDARVGGHGVQLMRHFLERLDYVREGEENRLTLVAAA